MAVQLFSNQALTVGQTLTATSTEMPGRRIVFRWVVQNTSPTLVFSGRGTLRTSDGRVLIAEQVAAEPGQRVAGETVYDSTVPAGAYVALEGFQGEAKVDVYAVDLDPVTADQAGSGWANYSHAGTVQAPLKGVWTTLVNDGLGARTDKTFLPIGVSDVFDCANSRFDRTHVSYGAQVEFRVSVTVNPNQNNRDALLRLNFDDGVVSWNFLKQTHTMKLGAGLDYPIIEEFNFHIANLWTSGLVITPQVFHTSNAANVTMDGYYIRIN